MFTHQNTGVECLAKAMVQNHSTGFEPSDVDPDLSKRIPRMRTQVQCPLLSNLT